MRRKNNENQAIVYTVVFFLFPLLVPANTELAGSR